MVMMLCAGILALAVKVQPGGADEAQLGLKLTMAVEKIDYYVGEPINVTLTITNISNQTIDFLYMASTFDFLVYNDTGSLYQWSSFRVFPLFVVNWPLGPEENITNVLTWPQTCNVTETSQGIPVSPGAYYILGEIPSYGLQAGPIEVNVDQPISLIPLKTVVGQGYDLPLNVSITNLDDSPEAFNVTLSINATAIGTETDINVSQGTSTLSFTWNTTSFELGHYNLTVTADNLSAECSVVLTIPGDLKGDFKVDLQDLVLLANAYNSTPGSAKWNPNADIDGKGVVGLSDLVILAQHYGQQQIVEPIQSVNGYYLPFEGNISRIFVVSENASYGFYPYATRTSGGVPVVTNGEPCVIINVTVRNDYSTQYPPPYPNPDYPTLVYVILTATVFNGANQINATDLLKVGLPPDAGAFADLNGGENATLSMYLATNQRDITSFQIVPIWIGGIPPA